MSSREITREQILGMSAGRELDGLVAVIVMGVEEVTIVGKHYFIDPLDKILPSYSTDLAAAYKAEEQMLQLPEISLPERYIDHLRWLVKKQRGYSTAFWLVHATPEQRCKAALLSLLKED
jgi:hypothetical protein